MKYRDRTTGQVYTPVELQQKFSTVSFPSVWDTSTYDFANVDPVIIVHQSLPSTVCMQMVYEGVQYVDNKWIDVWNEVPIYSNPTEQATCEQELIDVAWDHVRNQRNIRLAETDYTQIVDTPITADSRINFQTYRQALRDITVQADPLNIVWPTRPNYEKE